MRWPSLSLIVLLGLLVFAAGAGALFTPSQRSVLPLHAIFEGENLEVTPDMQDRSDLLPPPETEIVRDVVYGPHGWRNQLDLCLPKDAPRPLPVVIFIHGGGHSGSAKPFDGTPVDLALPLLKRGIAVAQINYRVFYVSPEEPNAHNDRAAPFPAQIHDCKAAVRFLRQHGGEYGLDPDRIGAMGVSFGGYLAALVGTSGGAEALFPPGRNRETSDRVQAVCAINGPTDLRTFFHQAKLHWELFGIKWDETTANYRIHFQALLHAFGDNIDRELETAGKASPVTYVSRDDPPFLLIHGFRDLGVPPHQGEQLFVRLKNEGVDAQMLIVPGGGHAGPTIDSPRIRTTIAEFFEQRL